MDLFSIFCTTCKTRLKVREESAIGQILACPKCGGMVMVKPPAGWKKGEPLPEPAPPAAPAITTVVEVRRPDETLGDSNFDVVEDLLSDAPPRIRSSVTVAPDAPGLARPRFAGAPLHPGNGAAAHAPGPVATPAAAPQSGAATPRAQATTAPVPPPAAVAGEAAAPRGTATALHSPPAAGAIRAADALKPPPPAEQDQALPLTAEPSAPPAWRYWAMMAGSVLVGITLALAVVAGTIRLFRGRAPVAQAPATSIVSIPNSATGPAENTAANSAASATGAVSSPTEAPAVETTSPPVVPPVENPGAVAPPAETKPETPPPAVKPVAEPAEPLELTAPGPNAVANPGDPLAKFDRLLSGDANSLPAQESPPPAVELPAPTAEKPVLLRPEPRSVNVSARLADALPGIETRGTPLADFLQFFSDLSTIPITLQPDALPLVRATPESPVVLKAAGTTIGAALTDGLTPLGLEYVALENEIVVRVAEPAVLPTLNYPVKDLAADEAAMTELAELLKGLIEPGSWNEDGGTLAVDAAKSWLTVRQSRAVHAQLLIACEKLRSARNLPLATSGKYDPSFFSLATRAERAQARLETPISLNFGQPAPLVTILDRLGEAGGVRILVDWQDIAAAGWNPDGEATLIADKQPLSAALDALLGPMDLVWRVVDGRTIQVLTPDSLAARLELELYKVDGLTGDDPSGDALLAKLQTALGEAIFREAGGTGELRYDPAGQCLLASLPQPKQRELEALLAKWRGELPPK